MTMISWSRLREHRFEMPIRGEVRAVFNLTLSFAKDRQFAAFLRIIPKMGFVVTCRSRGIDGA